MELGGKIYKCQRCDWEGIPDEADISVVNAKAKSYVRGTRWGKPESFSKKASTQNLPNSEKLKEEQKDKKVNSKKENEEEKEDTAQHKITNDIQPHLNRETSKVPKNKEILDRIKARNFGDAEFM